jgi:hypothetical protein
VVSLWVLVVAFAAFLCYHWTWQRLWWETDGGTGQKGPAQVEQPSSKRSERLYWRALSLDDPKHCTFVIGVGASPRGRELRQLLKISGFRRPFRKPRLFYVQGRDAEALRLAQAAGLRGSHADVVFSSPHPDKAVDGVIGCAVSHLLALRKALERQCETALFLEDDTSLELVGLWDKPVADSIREYASEEYPVLQMELKMRSFLERGNSGSLGLEQLPVRCGMRHTVPHQFKVTYGTGAYGMLRSGVERTLRRFLVDDTHGMQYNSIHQKPVDVSKVIVAGGHADVYIILNSSTTRVLWPPYFHEELDSKSLVRPGEGIGNSHQPQHVASAKQAIKANLRWARACREYVLSNRL